MTPLRNLLAAALLTLATAAVKIGAKRAAKGLLIAATRLVKPLASRAMPERSP